ncbi:hypothetical protein PHISCL_00889 [Aspergillus sclerotialis]|uniref:Extracellular membrane protein CFEM domain-containing protein n=1 Tax=Aspergillus sclerotialis TaxID=2070753 RepID=A0A3A2ZZF3_9EURO|nr:hypothetical protein PHISCL_00889 [Aspergillus sclerotialis]
MHLLSTTTTTISLLTLLSLLNPATAKVPENCGSLWRSQCTQAWSECCWKGAEHENTTCTITRSQHYWAVGRCAKLYDSAKQYGKVDCDTARLAGIAMLLGDRERGLTCSLDDIKDLEYPGDPDE